jgi:porin
MILAVAAAAVLLLVGTSPVKGQPSEEKTPPTESSSQAPRKESPSFDDKATGGWWGERRRLDQAGIEIGASLVLEGFKNFRGGLHTDSITGSSIFDLYLSIDTEKLMGWKGGKFYADLEDHAGPNPSTNQVGDLQMFDKLNAEPSLQIFELWYEQKLFNDRLRIKIGKVDANTELSVIENGLQFLNASTQASPTIFLFPTTPDPMPSINLFLTPATFYYASFGAYYSNRSVAFGNFVGSPRDIQLSNNGAFLIGETGLRWQSAPVLAKDGNLKLGAWGHTGTFTRFDGSRKQGASGYYVILDQTLWQPAGEPEDGRGLRTFLEYGHTQSTVNAIDWNIAGGLAWQGPFPTRSKDVLGIGPDYAHISPRAGLPKSYELAIETFYNARITGWLAIQPDLQYIVNPGGQYADALVGTLHLKVDF